MVRGGCVVSVPSTLVRDPGGQSSRVLRRRSTVAQSFLVYITPEDSPLRQREPSFSSTTRVHSVDVEEGHVTPPTIPVLNTYRDETLRTVKSTTFVRVEPAEVRRLVLC